MKHIRTFLTALCLCALLCVSALAASGGFNAGLQVVGSANEITVTVANDSATNAILAEHKPVLDIPCDFQYAKVTYNGVEIDCTVANGEVSFSVTAGGTYIITKMDAPSPEPSPEPSPTPEPDIPFYPETPTPDASNNVTIPAGTKDGTTVTLSAQQTPDAGEKVTVRIPATVDSVVVEIPVTYAGPGTVVVIVHENGTEEIVPKTHLTGHGVAVTLTGTATIKIVDNSKNFDDVADEHWAEDAITFATSRELFNGTGGNSFSPDTTMDRAMLATVLWRLEGQQNTALNSDFSDIVSGSWYEDAIHWAAEAGIIQGYGDTFGVGDAITREQLATILYRLSGSPVVSGHLDGVSDWASDAMVWAVQNGLLQGGDTGLNPQGSATRAQVATILMRFISL